MPRYNVEHNGKWACFSSIVDGFITEFDTKSAYENWRRQEQGMCNSRPAEECNMMTLIEAVNLIRIHHDYSESLAHLVECGLSEYESEKLLNDIETELYCPVKTESGFKCPYCGYEDPNSWEAGESDDDYMCSRCGKFFGFKTEVIVTYSSYKLK